MADDEKTKMKKGVPVDAIHIERPIPVLQRKRKNKIGGG